MSKELAKTYDPKGLEDRIYQKWLDNKYFHAEVNRDKKPFTIVMPPPNVTGQLHMGHALDETMQDILIRFKRMQGYEALWQPGTDHAAIATEVKVIEKFTIVMPPPNVTGQLHMGHALDETMQDILIRFKRMQGYEALWQPGTDHAAIATEVKVIEKLKEQGIDKNEIGREEFLKHAWEWKEEYGGKIINQLKKLGASADWDREKEEYGGKIINQLKKLGASADWDRERFTMDEGCSKAVQEVFIKLYEKGYIYKGSRIINWCPVCQTSISDAEVEHEDQDGFFWHINYPVVGEEGQFDAEVEHEDQDGFFWHINYPVVGEEGQFVEIATTRPETLLGDTAVAVNPEDERYKHLVGKMLKLPLTDREIPVVADEYVDKEFGTGCVKITPAHDPNDFEVGKRHNLPEINMEINIMNDDATINELGGKYAGMDRYEARKAMVEDLKELGLLVKVVPHSHNVGTHDRCGTTVEPMIKPQWFVRMKEMGEAAIKTLQDGNLQFVPDRFDKIYMHWLENIRDWCISRQLWWGHRIPAYYCDECGETVVAREMPGKCPKCGWHWLENIRDWCISRQLWWGHRIPAYYCDECGETVVAREMPGKCPKCGCTHLTQDEDTLDTWFSSALWPFSTLGWPDKTEEMEYFYPTDVLVTGYDIIFFWVIRMVFSGLEQTGKTPFHHVIRMVFSGLEQTGKTPFHHVLIHGLVRDSQGRKMSKSLGNGIDPLEIIDQYGADALRLTLMTGNAPGNDMRFYMERDMRFYMERVEASRNFANKVWNASRFIMMNLEKAEVPAEIDLASLTSADKWILSKVNTLAKDVTENLDKYELGIAVQKVYDFIWEEFCDW